MLEHLSMRGSYAGHIHKKPRTGKTKPPLSPPFLPLPKTSLVLGLTIAEEGCKI